MKAAFFILLVVIVVIFGVVINQDNSLYPSATALEQTTAAQTTAPLPTPPVWAAAGQFQTPKGWDSVIGTNFNSWAHTKLKGGMADKFSKLGRADKIIVLKEIYGNKIVVNNLYALAAEHIKNREFDAYTKRLNHLKHLHYGEPDYKKYSHEAGKANINSLANTISYGGNILKFREKVDGYSHKYIAMLKMQ